MGYLTKHMICSAPGNKIKNRIREPCTNVLLRLALGNIHSVGTIWGFLPPLRTRHFYDPMTHIAFRDYYGTLADLKAKHILVGLKEAFSNIEKICYICQATNQETKTCTKLVPSPDRDLEAWKKAQPKDETDKEALQILSSDFDAKRASSFITFEKFALRSFLPDLGHSVQRGVGQQQSMLLFQKDMNVKKKPNPDKPNRKKMKKIVLRVFNNKEWDLIVKLIAIYPHDRRDMRIEDVPERLSSFTMAQVMSWMKMAPVVLSYFLLDDKNKKCNCHPKKTHTPVVRPISKSLRDKFGLNKEHRQRDHIIYISSLYRILMKASNQNGVSVAESKLWQKDLIKVMELGGELNGTWTPKHHYTAVHTLTEIGQYISHLRDSNTLVCEQDNKLIKKLATNGKDAAFFLNEKIACIKGINMYKETNIFIPRLLMPGPTPKMCLFH